MAKTGSVKSPLHPHRKAAAICPAGRRWIIRLIAVAAGTGGRRPHHLRHRQTEPGGGLRDHVRRRLRHHPPQLGLHPGRAVLLLSIGIGLAPAFKMKFWNIGAEGQILHGRHRHRRLHDLLRRQDLPNWLLILVMALASIAGGRHLGPDPRHLQGQLGHQRDACSP